MPDTATVPIKSAALSKINWTQAVAMFSMALALFTGNKMQMTAEQQSAMVITITFLQSLLTAILRTYYNGSVSPSSLPAK